MKMMDELGALPIASFTTENVSSSSSSLAVPARLSRQTMIAASHGLFLIGLRIGSPINELMPTESASAELTVF